MDVLSVLLLAAPMVALDIDLEKVAPGYEVVSRERIITATKERSKPDEPEVEVCHYLGRARAYGYIECNFVIRAATREHAYALLKEFVGRLNSPEFIVETKRQGMGQFNFNVISDEASNADIHNLMDYAAGQRSHLIMLDGRIHKRV
jgi:hypothetical protein